MATFGVRPWCLIIVVLLVADSRVEAREVTHEDLRDALLSLIHLFRGSESKLDRHEAREKALGDQLKKSLVSLEKKHKALEPLDGLIRRLDNRLSNVETIFFQKEEKEKATQQKTNEMLRDIQNSLQTLTTTVNDNLKRRAPEESNLTTDDDTISRRLDATDAKLDAVKQEIQNLKNSFNKDALRAVCLEMVTDVNPFERHISEAEKLLNKYELKLNEYNETSSKVPTDFVPLSEVTLADEAWHNKMSEVMERQEGEIKKIQQLLSSAESMWKDLPRLADLNRATNDTLEALTSTQSNLTTNDMNTVSQLTTKLHEIRDQFIATNQDIQQSLTQGNTMSEQSYNEILKNYDALKKEIWTLTKIEADDSAAVKKRIEYGVNRILVELSENIKLQGRLLDNSVHDNFNAIEKEILANQTAIVGNLTSKIDGDMSQVWRQMGNMYQQLIASKASIDKLNELTAQYYNGTAKSVDGINAQVDSMTKHVNELSNNLNYAMGIMRLDAQEFNHLKTGLQEALHKAKIDLPEVFESKDNSTDAEAKK